MTITADPTDVRPFILDISSWQGKIDPQKIFDPTRQPRVRGVIVRAFRGVLRDTRFKENWAVLRSYQKAVDPTVRLGIYGALWPQYSPTAMMYILQQQLLLDPETGKADWGDFPFDMDCEVAGYGATKWSMVRQYENMVDLIEDASNRSPMIYSRKTFLDDYTNARYSNTLCSLTLHLAQYMNPRYNREHPGPPAVPIGFSRELVVWHQTADHGDPIGIEGKQMDYNRGMKGTDFPGDYTPLSQSVNF